jgi:hypothetical protein
VTFVTLRERDISRVNLNNINELMISKEAAREGKRRTGRMPQQHPPHGGTEDA